MNEEQFSTWQLMWRAENEAYLRDIPVEDELIGGNISALPKIILGVSAMWMRILGESDLFTRNFQPENAFLPTLPTKEGLWEKMGGLALNG